MTDSPISSFDKYINSIRDPRHHNIHHRLHDILYIALCAIISGAVFSRAWPAPTEYGRSKFDWFKEFLELPNGIPSHDTFGRLFARLDPKGFQDFFARWVQDLATALNGKTVAIDGKTLRRSHDRANAKSAIHMVSAWASELRLVLGQLKTNEKSNEINAIPELIKTLALEGAVITIDAMGCQKKIVHEIVESKADYVIQVKDNQPNLRENIDLFFQDSANGPFESFATVDGEHGRVENRQYFTSSDIDWLPGKHEWENIESIAMVIRQRDVNGNVSTEKSYYISSLESQADTIGKHIRNHWGVENDLHWCLDVSFQEDRCRVRKDHAPENFGILRHLAINLLKREKSLKGGIQAKRLKAAWDHEYLLKLLKH